MSDTHPSMSFMAAAESSCFCPISSRRSHAAAAVMLLLGQTGLSLFASRVRSHSGCVGPRCQLPNWVCSYKGDHVSATRSQLVQVHRFSDHAYQHVSQLILILLEL